jgi:endonuclease-3 related protein
VAFLDERYSGSLTRMFARPTEDLRQELLALNGVGPETADSILLYAGNHPVFVVDAYTRRILARHEILSEKTPYEEIRELMEAELTPLASEGFTEAGEMPDEKPVPSRAAHSPSPMSTAKRGALVQVYNEMHGLIVGVGKSYCLKSQPRCDQCPLQRYLPNPD